MMQLEAATTTQAVGGGDNDGNICAVDTGMATSRSFRFSIPYDLPEKPFQQCPTEDTQTTGSFFGFNKKSTISKVVNHIKEYHWKVDLQWEVSIYAGTNANEKRVVQSGS